MKVTVPGPFTMSQQAQNDHYGGSRHLAAADYAVALNAEINKRTVKKTATEWIEILNKAGVPCGPIYTIDKMFADPQVRHLGIAQTLNGGNRGDVAYVGQPIDLSRTPAAIVSHPPGLGEHTEEILRDLGLDAAEIADLRARQVV